jgi:hypothetical protein
LKGKSFFEIRGILEMKTIQAEKSNCDQMPQTWTTLLEVVFKLGATPKAPNVTTH